MTRWFAFPVFFFVTSLMTASEKGYITHIATTWNTYLLVDNMGAASADFTLKLFGESGTPLGQSNYQVGPGAFMKLLLGDIAADAHSGMVEYESADLEFRAAFVHPSEKGTAMFVLPDAGNRANYFNMGSFETSEVNLTWKGIAVMNLGDTEASITITAYDSIGTSLDQISIRIAPMQRYRNTVSAMFPNLSNPITSVARVVTTSEGNTMGLSISGDGGAQLLFANATARAAGPAGGNGGGVWSAEATASPVAASDMGTMAYNSSSKMDILWTAPTEPVSIYHITATDGISGRSTLFEVSGNAETTRLTGLKSDTAYTITLKACLDASCTSFLTAASELSLTLPAEVWQVYGEGSGWENSFNLTSDCNVKPFVIPYGDWAGPGLSSTLRMYYDPLIRENKGVGMSYNTLPLVEGDMDSFGKFTKEEGYGLMRYLYEEGLDVPHSGTHQAIPLADGTMRLYIEGDFIDKDSQIYAIDSVDGYLGLDFNTSEATTCITVEDWNEGACPYFFVFGADDGFNDLSMFKAIRQFKIIYPTADSWVWDEAVGTPMVVTLHFKNLDTPCSDVFFNGGYATWNGTNWELEYDEAGCPKSWPAMQAPTAMHLGGSRYKMYYSHNETPISGSGSPFDLKPVQLIYGESERSGDSSQLEFEDWDSADAARQVHILWPDGTLLAEDGEENYIDDFQAIMPTDNPDFQLIYTNAGMTCAVMKLINP